MYFLIPDRMISCDLLFVFSKKKKKNPSQEMVLYQIKKCLSCFFFKKKCQNYSKFCIFMHKGHLKREMIASHFHVRHLQKKEKGPMTRKHSKAAVENRLKHVFLSFFLFCLSIFSSFSNTSLQTKQPFAFPPFLPTNYPVLNLLPAHFHFLVQH